jgi:hypothetical protein
MGALRGSGAEGSEIGPLHEESLHFRVAMSYPSRSASIVWVLLNYAELPVGS